MGAYAAQEYGCLRYTNNVDLIVPDVARAHELLCANGFHAHLTVRTTVVDPDFAFEVRLHQGERSS